MSRTVEDLADDVARGVVSARELVTDCLARIDAVDPPLNAWVHVDAEQALRCADRIDDAVAAGDEVGPLAGVPFGVKDLEDVRGMPTTKGSRWFTEAAPASQDEIHVERLRRAGAIPVGKTATPEFGWAAHTASLVNGVTRNPWNLTRTPGGSSGGTAAAVASATIPFGTASDGGGSIRTPANFTGLPGLRPSYGRVPTLGATHLAQNAVNFALATSVRDTALLLDVCSGPDARDRTCLPATSASFLQSCETSEVSGLRVAVSMSFGLVEIAAETRRLVSAGIENLVGAAGLEVVDVDLSLEPFFDVYNKLEGVDQFIGVPDRLWPDRSDELDPLVRPGWESASRARLPQLAAVMEQRRRIEHTVASWFDRLDCFITPTSSTPAFAAEGPWPDRIDDRTVDPFLCIPQPILPSIVNLPAITLPVGSNDEGLPVGMQVVAGRHREDLLLRLARIYEQAHPWPRHAPTQ